MAPIDAATDVAPPAADPAPAGPRAPIGQPEPVGAEATRRDRVPFLALFAANSVSLFGNALTSLAIPWFVLETTGSAARTGLTAVAGTVPTILAMAFGGAIVDRLGPKRMSVVADLASGATVAAIPLLHHTTGLAFWQLLVLVALGALLDSPGHTARMAIQPDVAVLGGVPLERANAAGQAAGSLSLLLGPPVAGILVAVVGTSNVLWLDAATFAVSAAAVAGLVPSPPRAVLGADEPAPSYWRDLREGWGFLFGDRVLRAIAVTATVINFLLAPLAAVVLPVYVEDAFGSARALGWVLGAFGAGSLVGAVAYGVFGPRLPRRATLIGGLLLAGFPLLLLSTTPPLAATVAAAFAVDLFLGPVNPLAGTVMQERVPAALRGRVFGTLVAVAMLAAPVGMLVAGVALEVIGVGGVVASIAVAFLAVSLSMLANPAFRQLGGPGALKAAAD